MILSGQLQITGVGGMDYSPLIQNFNPQSLQELQKKFPVALETLITHENGEEMFTDPRFIFDYEEWRLYIHRCITEDGEEQVISVFAYNVKFDAMPMPMQVNRVGMLLTYISNGELDEGTVIRSWPGHVALMFPVD